MQSGFIRGKCGCNSLNYEPSTSLKEGIWWADFTDEMHTRLKWQQFLDCSSCSGSLWNNYVAEIHVYLNDKFLKIMLQGYMVIWVPQWQKFLKINGAGIHGYFDDKTFSLWCILAVGIPITTYALIIRKGSASKELMLSSPFNQTQVPLIC